jgi:hypothetical protein
MDDIVYSDNEINALFMDNNIEIYEEEIVEWQNQ